MKPSIHIISPPLQEERWRELKEKGENIISSWINEDNPYLSDMSHDAHKKFILANIQDCQKADYTIVYCHHDLDIRFAILIIGIAIGAGKLVLMVNNLHVDHIVMDELRHVANCINSFETIQKALMFTIKN